MPISPTIQGLLGANIAQNTGNTLCAVDWANSKVGIVSDVSSTSYIATCDVISGVQLAFHDLSTYTHDCSDSASTVTVGVDANGNYYLIAGGYGLDGGGILCANGTTLAEISVNGANAAPPDGFFLQGGTITNIPVSTTQFIAMGLPFSQNFQIQNQTTFAGSLQHYIGSSSSCTAGALGSHKAFYVGGPTGPTDPQVLTFYGVTCTAGGIWVPGDWPTPNPNIVTNLLVSLVPTDVDAGWTNLFCTGMAIDQADENILVCVNGNNTGGASFGYIIKLNSVTGAIIWNSPIPQALGRRQLAYSSIKHQKLCLIASVGGFHVITINTSTGAQTSEFAGFENLTGMAIGQQCFNDTLGAILFVAEYDGMLGASPAPLNSTPTNYTGWSMLYVAEPNPAPAANTHASYTRIWGNYH